MIGVIIGIAVVVLLVVLIITNSRKREVVIYREPAQRNTDNVQRASQGSPSLKMSDRGQIEGMENVQYAPAYDPAFPGPDLINPIGVPVPAGAFKETNPRYNRAWMYGAMPGPFVSSVNKLVPTPWTAGVVDSLNLGNSAFISATNGVDTWGQMAGPAPFADVYSGVPGPLVGGGIPNPMGRPVSPAGWEKVGIVQTKNGNGVIMNLYQRPIAPIQDLFEYQVEDRDGFVIPLKEKTFLSDGDTIHSIRGKENEGEWRVDIFENEKYIWF